MKFIYILIAFYITLLFNNKVYACGTDPSFNNDAQRQLDCLKKIYWGMGYIQGGTSNSISTTLSKEVEQVKTGIITSNSSLESIEIKSGSNLVLLLKDTVLMDFIYKFVMIFGVGYLIAYNVFKR